MVKKSNGDSWNCREPLCNMVEVEILQDHIEEMVNTKMQKFEAVEELNFQIQELDNAISNATKQIRELSDQ